LALNLAKGEAMARKRADAPKKKKKKTKKKKKKKEEEEDEEEEEYEDEEKKSLTMKMIGSFATTRIHKLVARGDNPADMNPKSNQF